jgi:hypothetical protein
LSQLELGRLIEENLCGVGAFKDSANLAAGMADCADMLSARRGGYRPLMVAWKTTNLVVGVSQATPA